MIVGTVFPSILNQMEFHLVQNQMENYPHDHIPFNVKGIGNIVFSVRASNSARHVSARGEMCSASGGWNFKQVQFSFDIFL